jgi:lysophospholipase L1-like esterase
MVYLQSADVVLFQGDSITHGGRGENQWNKNHILGHGYQTLLAGRMAMENLDRMPLFLNRGVSGDRTSDLLERWDRDTIALSPTVLSILIGVNNCLIPTAGADRIYYKELCSLLEKTRTAIPEIRLILCEPFAFELSAYKSEEERDFVRRRIELTQSCAAYAKIAADRYGALFVPFWRVLAEYVKRCPADSVVWDGIHPTFIGHEIMAAQWYDKVDSSGLFTGQT